MCNILAQMCPNAFYSLDLGPNAFYSLDLGPNDFLLLPKLKMFEG